MERKWGWEPEGIREKMECEIYTKREVKIKRIQIWA